MTKSLLLSLTTLFATVLFSCSEKETISNPANPAQVLQFEVVDSIMVDALEMLAVLDYLPSKDLYLMKELRKGNIFLVNGEGKIIDNRDIAGEGPDQIQMVAEGRFYGEEGYLFKEFSGTMDFSLYNLDFKKIKKFDGTLVELNSLSIYNYKQSFSVFEEQGKSFIVGEEPNSFSKAAIDHEKIGADFYNQANAGFIYDLDEDSITYVNTYPEDWEPKKTQKWVGESYPFLSYNPKTKKVASLPVKGNQMGLYRLDGYELIYETGVELSHPDREGHVADTEKEAMIYPSFADIKAFGDYQLVQFYTAMPEDIYNGFRAKGENFQSDPEYRDAMIKYRKLRNIIVKGDRQIGILNEFPVAGSVNLGLPDGTLIIKAADGEVERDYNLFYKVRLVED
ncbi:hypothetical protein [Algoriphagus winogradskyi]|uniref:Cyclic nucleotide-binding domain-containing protein n=1 Tax=Algoriphagus winogradskyi TaxID=237017 RepID=A0ABY1PC25_9BACT|nr:hypothetical protein [Algoriphagus winogradskyi]SMP30183.1 hypothetical protein SAMN06265367_106283 [Algoriphagus winogradskyi]